MSDMVLSSGPMNGEMVQLIKDSIAKDATDTELALFIQQCNRTQLDPFAKQIHLVARWDSKLGREVRTSQVSIDGMRLVAQRSQEYAGQTPTYWCGSDGVWTDVWLSKTHPEAAKVGIYRQGFAEPLWTVATWDQYAVYITPKGKERYLSPFWSKMPSLMLGKCAEALALRKSFPMELSGLYIPEEMGDDERPRRRSKRSAPAPTLSGETITRSAPVIDVDGTDDQDGEIMASGDELNALEGALHGLGEEQTAAIKKEWKSQKLPKIADGLTSEQLHKALGIISAVVNPVTSEREYDFAPEGERFA